MTVEREREPRPSLSPQARGAAAAAAAAAVALTLLWAMGQVTLLGAGLAFLFIAAAALWGVRTGAGVPAARLAAADEAQRQDSSRRLVAGIVAALPDPAVALDRDGRVIAFNEAARAVAPALRTGEHALLALRSPPVVDAVRRSLASGEPQQAEFSERVPIDRWYEAHVIPATPTAELDRGLYLLVLHDLTPMRRIEEMRADFVANASHELRTPLAALSGFIDTLQGSARDDPDARERFLAIMREQARRMARLIDDLLSLSRIELAEHIRPDTPIELTGVLRQVVDGLQPLARERGVDVKVAAEAPLIVPGDRDELIRVFENLVENALKYGASGKRVDIAVERSSSLDGPEAKVLVRDYGPGIAAEHLPRLTERFYRVDVGQSRAEGGTGLGLALVKHILARHRGRLQIESTPGHGSTFTAHLPALARPGDEINDESIR